MPLAARRAREDSFPAPSLSRFLQRSGEMKNALVNSLGVLFALFFVSACLTVFAQAQNREEHFISARAGGVNLASGDVKVRRAGADDWQTLSVKDDLKNGDVVRVGASGRVEVLLNPGSY